MDVDTRLLRYFQAVAEEGNITKAAARLYISQPALTKQIRQLEDQLGASLFERSRSGMALTGPGEALAASIGSVLDAWCQAECAVRAAAAEASKVLRVGFLASAANEKTQEILAEFRERRPDWRVELRQASWGAPIEALVSGEVEAAFMRLPFPNQDDFHLLELLTEPRCVAMAANHPLAQRRTLRFEELLDEPFVAAPAATGAFRDHWIGAEARDGRPVRVGAVTEHPDDWLTAIANGHGIALAPQSAARYYARPDIAYRDVEGIAPSTVALAWSKQGAPTPALTDFIAAARTHADCAVRPRCRSDSGLALVRAADQDAMVIDFTSRLLAGLARAGESEAIRRVVPEALPWSTFLPQADRDQLLAELIEVAQGTASLRKRGPIAVLLEQWRHSAEIYGDTDLYEQVTAEPGGDLGPIAKPGESA